MTSSTSSEGTTRRQFLKLAIGVLTFLSGLILGIPFLASLIGLASRTKKAQFAKVANISDLPQGEPKNINYPDVEQDAFIKEKRTRNVWVIKHSQNDITVFSPICPHLGCRYNWDSQNKYFICPCHGSKFTLDGKVIGGPAPRPLDTLPIKIYNDELLVEWELFEIGISQKIKV